MASEQPPASAGGIPRFPWLAAAAAAFLSYQIGPLAAFWGAQMKGADPEVTYITPHMQFLEKAASAGRPAAIVGAIVALIAVGGASDTTSGLRATIVGVVVGTVGGFIAGFLTGYF
jgi:hypothetical protein